MMYYLNKTIWFAHSAIEMGKRCYCWQLSTIMQLLFLRTYVILDCLMNFLIHK